MTAASVCACLALAALSGLIFGMSYAQEHGDSDLMRVLCGLRDGAGLGRARRVRPAKPGYVGRHRQERSP